MDTINIERIKGWLQECTDNHESCRKQAQLCTIWSSDNMHIVRDLGHEDQMPRRLLEFPTDGNGSAKLVDTHEPTPYLALSHRWGEKETCICTRENLEDLQRDGLPISSLPQTYHDAIVVTTKLGFHHLWIDSLCIIQNDVEDWKEEAPRMAVIYGNAVLTIAAMDAETSEGGLFAQAMEKEKRGSLELRAWVTQERMISPRSLVFTGDSIVWECRESDAKDTDTELVTRQTLDQISNVEKDGEPPAKKAIPDHPKELFAFFRDFRLPGVTFDENQHEFMSINSDLLGDRDDYDIFLQAWWRFISFYTPRRLTFGKDKFLAMNGIAAASMRWTQMKNTFGLWFHFIEHELLWSVDPDGPEATKPGSFRTPSWSWASLNNGRVVNKYYERLPLKPELKLKPKFVMPVGTSFDQTLPIPAWTSQHYTIKLWGSLRSAEIHTKLGDDGKPRHHVTVDPVGRWSDKESYDFIPDIRAWFPVDKVVKVTCLHVLQYQKEDGGLPHYIDVYLVLNHVNPTNQQQELKLYEEDVPEGQLIEERTFRRLGYMETTYDEMRNWNDIWEDIWWRYLVLK